MLTVGSLILTGVLSLSNTHNKAYLAAAKSITPFACAIAAPFFAAADGRR